MTTTLNIDNEIKILTAVRQHGTEIKVLASVPATGDLAEALDFIKDTVEADMIVNTQVEQDGEWADQTDPETGEWEGTFTETTNSEVFYEIQVSCLVG